MKLQMVYECSKCGAQTQKWQGRCLECGSWGTMSEGNPSISSGTKQTAGHIADLTDFNKIQGQDVARKKTGINEMDRVLGGGIVPGSLILIGGEPGIGKSTLLLQLASAISSPVIPDPEHQRGNYSGIQKDRDSRLRGNDKKEGGNDKERHSYRDVIYNSGEESAEQIKLRFDRLGLKTDDIKYLGETDIDTVCATIKKNKPMLAIIDSIQTATSQDVDSSFGGVGQIKVATAKLMEVAKKDNIPIIIVGHITKGGDIAGPKLLEHMVDTVLYFEGEKLSHYRMLRAVKNRFGNTNEVGIFEMTGDGLKEVANPSAAFLENKSDVSGSVLTCTLNGSRPFLVEVQALTNPTQFGNPMRKSSGFDLNRLNIISTIINQRTDIKCSSHDIILNIAGGIKIQDPAADLAVALAIISSIKNKVLPKKLVALGELGLGGELRKINQLEKRTNEAKRLGLNNILSPENSKTLSDAIKNLIF